MELFLHAGMFVRRWRIGRAQHVGSKMMDLYLQFGYGMMEHCRTLVTRWGGGTVILSPRDLTDEQVGRLGASIRNLPGGQLWLDPQFYLPHADHERLCSHAYWPQNYQTGMFWQGPALTTLLDELNRLNDRLATSAYVLPGILAASINDDWFATQEAVLEEAIARNYGRPIVTTIALSAEVVTREDQIALLLERADKWKTSGYYIVCEHPHGQYLVDNANWLANVIDLAAGLRLTGANVVLGYCNHQMLIAGLAKVNAISSGTWMNVRSFPPEKFNSQFEDELKQRATWYYCPQSLSEYKIPFLDIAQRLRLLDRLAPPADLDGGYASALFSGAQPSSVGFSEQMAFRHYLHCLRGQVRSAQRDTFDDTVVAHRELLDTAETLLATLAASGIRGQQRDFRDIIDVNRAALELFTSLRGAILRRRWTSL
jgi:hypothetical protein